MKCKACGEDVDEVFPAKVRGRTQKVCEDCRDKIEEEGEIAEAAEGAMQSMMGYKGRR